MLDLLDIDEILLKRIRGKYLLTTTIKSLNILQSRNKVKAIRTLKGLFAKISTHFIPLA